MFIGAICYIFNKSPYLFISFIYIYNIHMDQYSNSFEVITLKFSVIGISDILMHTMSHQSFSVKYNLLL